MKDLKIPGAAWVIALAIVNVLPAALNDAFPGAAWVPLVVDLLLVGAKAIQVYMPKDVEPVAPEAFVMPANYVSPNEPEVKEAGKVRTFLLG